MPNLKIFVDDALGAECLAAVRATLPPLREMLCRELRVDVSACQFAIIPVYAMADLPQINVEMQLLPKPDRPPHLVRGVCMGVRELLASVTSSHVAVRATALDPETYVALR